MPPLLQLFGYVSLLGPPRAVQLHRLAQGTHSELDGRPLWLAVTAEFVVRFCVFAVMTYGVQELIGREAFHRYMLSYAAVALGLAGAIHTLTYFLTLGIGVKHFGLSAMQRLYRLGRNWTYSVPPALLAGLLAVWWQDMRNIAPLQDEVLLRIVAATWLCFFVVGTLEGLLVKRAPTGIVIDP